MNDEVRSEVLKTIPYGFYIVGTTGTDGESNGLTANWVSQASFEPPQVAVVINQQSHIHALIAQSGVFSLNFLDKDREELAHRFARHVEPGGDSVAGARFTRGQETGAPLFEDSFAHLECRVVDSMETGDHTMFLGDVVGADRKRPADILTDLETPLSYGG